MPYLENPVLCADNLPELVGAMEMRFARLIGVAHCIVPQQIVDPSLHMQPPLTLQKMMKPQPMGMSPMLQPMEPPPSIVQIIVPAALIQETTINVTEETQKPQEKIEPTNDLNDTNFTPALTEKLSIETEHQEIPEEEIKEKEDATIRSHEIESVQEPDSPKHSIQDIPAEKSVDDSEVEEAPDTDPIQEFNKIRSVPDAYPPISLPEILHEVLPQPQRTHASLENEPETELEHEAPPQKDVAVHEEQHQQHAEQDDDDLLQETLADIVDDMPS